MRPDACHGLLRSVVIGTVLLTGACAGLPKPTVERHATPPAWQARCDRLSEAAWLASGRLSVREGNTQWTASVRWRQTPAGFVLRLWGPLGAGAVRVTGDAHGAELRTAQGETLRAADPETLFAQALGTRFPVSDLQSWAIGCPGSVHGPELGWDRQGRLTSLRQGDWRITIPEYRWGTGAWMPARVDVQHIDEPVSARLLVQRWQTGAAVDGAADGL